MAETRDMRAKLAHYASGTATATSSPMPTPPVVSQDNHSNGLEKMINM